MRVITGLAKGRRLRTLEGLEVRPTSDRVKEGLFSVIQFDIEGRRVLDLFAGSGQLGIEALSRGAEHATLVDNSSASVKVIRENLDTTGLEEKAEIHQQDVASFLAVCRQRFDIAFLDPPYRGQNWTELLRRLVQVMSKGGVILCEGDAAEEMPGEVPPFVQVKSYRYGKTAVTLYRHKEVTG